MSDVLEDFEYRRSPLQNMHFDEARARISGFLEWLQKEPKITSIIDDIRTNANVEDILKNKPPNASTPEEIAAIGLHLMFECLGGEEPWKLSLKYGIQPSYGTIAAQDLFDEVFNRFIDPAIDCIHRELVAKASSDKILPLSSTQSSKQDRKPPYVDTQRINDLKSITSSKFDLSRLIRLCEEINISHQNECYMSIAMAVRAIIDHVPPIFDFTTFSQVTNNYSGTNSFKDSMKNLENSLRKIADAHLHVKIRNRETLPTFNQVNFFADLDVLLSEIIRILK